MHPHICKREKNPPQAQYLLATFKREVQLNLNKRKTSTRLIQSYFSQKYSQVRGSKSIDFMLALKVGFDICYMIRLIATNYIQHSIIRSQLTTATTASATAQCDIILYYVLYVSNLYIQI